MQLTIRIDPGAYAQLERLALTERRRVRDQAAVLVERAVQDHNAGPTPEVIRVTD